MLFKNLLSKHLCTCKIIVIDRVKIKESLEFYLVKVLIFMSCLVKLCIRILLTTVRIHDLYLLTYLLTYLSLSASWTPPCCVKVFTIERRRISFKHVYQIKRRTHLR